MNNCTNDYIWLVLFFSKLFSSIDNVKLTENEKNNLSMLILGEKDDKQKN